MKDTRCVLQEIHVLQLWLDALHLKLVNDIVILQISWLYLSAGLLSPSPAGAARGTPWLTCGGA